MTPLRVKHAFLGRDEWRIIHDQALHNGGAIDDPYCVHAVSFAFDCAECRRELEAQS